jgi:osmoprotectant transport system substrate-binding protein
MSSPNQNTRGRIGRRHALAVGLAGTMVLAGCGSSSKSAATTGPAVLTVFVGSDQSVERRVLAEIYAETLENAGVRVGRKDPVATNDLAYQSVVSNDAQLIPQLTGSLLTYVLQQKDPKATATAGTVDDQVTALKGALPANVTIGDPASAEDGDVVACNAAAIDKYSVKNLSDLAKVADKVKLGGTAEVKDRTSGLGLAGLKATYSGDFSAGFTVQDAAAVAGAVAAGTVDCGVLPGLSPDIPTKGLVAVTDDKSLAAHEAVVPLITTAAATPEVLAAITSLKTTLTTDVLKSLLVKVSVDNKTPEEAAKLFIASQKTSSSGQ